jgi:lipoyl(octanoyl) transferase
VLFLEHPPTITLGRRTEVGEVHVPEGAQVDVVEVDRGGKSTYHAPGQLVCYPILDLTRHGQDVKRYCRDLEEALIDTIATFGVTATRLDGLTGVWLESPPRKIASIGIHLTKWVSTHGYALNVDLDPSPFTDWITACGLEGSLFTSLAAELGRPVSVDDVRPAAAQAFADVFDVAFEELPAGDPGLRPSRDAPTGAPVTNRPQKPRPPSPCLVAATQTDDPQRGHVRGPDRGGRRAGSPSASDRT